MQVVDGDGGCRELSLFLDLDLDLGRCEVCRVCKVRDEMEREREREMRWRWRWSWA